MVVDPRMSGSMAGTSGGGGGAGVPRNLSSIQVPRATGEVVLPLDVTAWMLAWVSRPPRTLADLSKRDSPEVRTVHIRDPVMSGESLVEHRPILSLIHI